MSRKNKRTLKMLIALFITFGIFLTQKPETVKPVLQKAEQSQPGLYAVTDFTDGDTISVDMNGVDEKIRMIGVDTPETKDPRKEVQCYGKAASAFTKTTIGDNKVRLEADPTNTNRDRYNRLLRYIYLPDGTLVNAEIIKQGYGFAYTYFPFEKLEEFKGYQKQAEENNAGLWGECSIETLDNGQTRTTTESN
jgi:endonuclease YncB( thermonuclease family)